MNKRREDKSHRQHGPTKQEPLCIRASESGQIAAWCAMSSIHATASDALARFEDAARLTRERLAKVRDKEVTQPATAAGGQASQEAASSLSWAAAMLLTTAEEALRTQQALATATNRSAVDQLERSQAAQEDACETAASAGREREAACRETAALGARIRREGVAARQRQAKDAARIQELTEQVAQLQANIRLADSAWAEERRAEQAAGAQRERNFQAVILRLQREVDAMALRAPASAAPAPAEAISASMASESSPGAASSGGEEEVAALKQRVVDLQAQCERGVALIERLKLRVTQQEKEKEKALRRESGLSAQLEAAEERSSQGTRQLRQLKEESKYQDKQGQRKRDEAERTLREQHAAEVRALSLDMDALQARASHSEQRAAAAAEDLRRVSLQLDVAEKVRTETEMRAQSAIVAAETKARTASVGAITLLKAALTESQKKLDATQKALEEVTASSGIAAAPRGASPEGRDCGARDTGRGSGATGSCATPATLGSGRQSPGGLKRVSYHCGGVPGTAPSAALAPAPTPLLATPEPNSVMSSVTPQERGEDQPMIGLNRMRASLLDSLRAERSKLERERSLLSR
jgi:hypothetical protein